MKRQFETDDGTLVMVPSNWKACKAEGNEVVARRSLSKRKKRNAKAKELFKRSERESQIVSPTLIVCEAAEQEGWFPPSLGGTNGNPRIDGVVTGRDLRRAGTTRERTEVWNGNLQAY